MPLSATRSTAPVPSASSVTRMLPSKVYLNAFEIRLSTMRSHISRSTYTGAGNGCTSTSRRRPPCSTVERKVLASSRVRSDRSSGSNSACERPASMREKSRRALTSFSTRSVLRCATSRSARSRGGVAASCRASSSGPSISVSGVRNSWLTLEKKAVFARSSCSSVSARWRSISWAAAVARAALDCCATRSKKPCVIRHRASCGR